MFLKKNCPHPCEPPHRVLSASQHFFIKLKLFLQEQSRIMPKQSEVSSKHPAIRLELCHFLEGLSAQAQPDNAGIDDAAFHDDQRPPADMQSVPRHHVEARKLSADTTPESGTIGKRQARVIVEPCIIPVLEGHRRFPAQIMLASTPCCLPDPFSLTLVTKHLKLSTRLSRITIRMVTRVQAYLVTALVDLAHQRANPRMPQLVESVELSRGVCGNEIESTVNPMTLIQGHNRGKIVVRV